MTTTILTNYNITSLVVDIRRSLDVSVTSFITCNFVSEENTKYATVFTLIKDTLCFDRCVVGKREFVYNNQPLF